MPKGRKGKNMMKINITMKNGTRRTEEAATLNFAVARATALNSMPEVKKAEVVWF